MPETAKMSPREFYQKVNVQPTEELIKTKMLTTTTAESRKTVGDYGPIYQCVNCQRKVSAFFFFLLIIENRIANDRWWDLGRRCPGCPVVDQTPSQAVVPAVFCLWRRSQLDATTEDRQTDRHTDTHNYIITTQPTTNTSQRFDWQHRQTFMTTQHIKSRQQCGSIYEVWWRGRANKTKCWRQRGGSFLPHVKYTVSLAVWLSSNALAST